jgi:hypothetical protein
MPLACNNAVNCEKWTQLNVILIDWHGFIKREESIRDFEDIALFEDSEKL